MPEVRSPVATSAASRGHRCSSKVADHRTCRRDTRSSTTPTNGPTIENRSKVMASTTAIDARPAVRSGRRARRRRVRPGALRRRTGWRRGPPAAAGSIGAATTAEGSNRIHPQPCGYFFTYSESLSFFSALDSSAILAVSTTSMLCPSRVVSKPRWAPAAGRCLCRSVVAKERYA